MFNFWSCLCTVALVAGLVALIYAFGVEAVTARTKKLCLLGAAVSLIIAYLAGDAWWRDHQVQQCCEALNDLGAAVELYYEGHNAYPQDLEELVPACMDELPVCPCSSQGWKYETGTEMFTITCQGYNHKGLGGAPENRPGYDAEKGVMRGGIL